MGTTVLIACNQETSKAKVYTSSANPIEVQAQAVRNASVPLLYSATGYTNVSRSIEISTSQSATIDELKVKEGDSVAQGELLVALDETELLTSIRRAESAIESAEIQLKDFAHDLDNARQLRKKRVITEEQLRKAKVQHNLAETQLQQAQSELERQLARKPYHRINSPINARVIKRWVNQGDLAVIGKPLLLLEAIGGLEFEATLPAELSQSIKVGDRYNIKIHKRDEAIPAIISHIVNSVDRITQTIQIKLALPESDELEAGLSGQVDFVIAYEDQTLVAASALVKRAGVFGVFRVEDNKAVFTPINFERQWQQYQVVLSGLNLSDIVVTNPPSSLKDGSPIVINAPLAKAEVIEAKQ
jgi:RND family efflux transporter MFP subunit